MKQLKIFELEKLEFICPTKNCAKFLLDTINLIDKYNQKSNISSFDKKALAKRVIGMNALYSLIVDELRHLSILHLGLDQDKLCDSKLEIQKHRLNNFLNAALAFKKSVSIKHPFEQDFFNNMQISNNMKNLNQLIDVEITTAIYTKMLRHEICVILTKFPKTYFIVTFNTKKNSKKIEKFVKENFSNYIWGDNHIGLVSNKDCQWLKLTFPEEVGNKIAALPKFIEPLELMIKELGFKFKLTNMNDIKLSG